MMKTKKKCQKINLIRLCEFASLADLDLYCTLHTPKIPFLIWKYRYVGNVMLSYDLYENNEVDKFLCIFVNRIGFLNYVSHKSCPKF